jgi:hypothetical protein
MRLDTFTTMVDGLRARVPPEFLDGIVSIEVSSKSVPHPVRAGVYTLGECIPLEWSGDGTDLHSRVVLYHGSFLALADEGGMDWREEAWETLTHELRHHLEWRANMRALERYDWAAEQNFARREGEPFDPLFYRAGELIAPGSYKVDDDFFLEQAGKRRPSAAGLDIVWHGRRYIARLPAELALPAFVTLHGLSPAPPGDAILVLRRRLSLLDVWRRPRITEHAATVERAT